MNRTDAGWRRVRLVTLARAERMGWRFITDPRRGPGARALLTGMEPSWNFPPDRSQSAGTSNTASLIETEKARAGTHGPNRI